jgi:UDP-glucose 4-epimerase
LVTGGGGFIGSHLVERLVTLGHSVRVLDDWSTGVPVNLASVQDRIEVVTGSILDADVLATAMRGAAWVFHLAARASVALSLADPAATHENIATGTLCVLLTARDMGVTRIVFAGSSSAYGDATDGPATELQPAAPASPYAAAKLAGEHYCRAFSTAFGMATTVLRFFNVYGPRQNPNSPYAAVIPRFLTAAARGEPLIIFGDGGQTRDFVHVGDAVSALVLAAENPGTGGVFNIGTGRSVSIRELARTVVAVTGSQSPIVHAAARAGEVRHSRADLTRARRDLGFEPAISLEQGLASMVSHIG